jgi:hypothetical protein
LQVITVAGLGKRRDGLESREWTATPAASIELVGFSAEMAAIADGGDCRWRRRREDEGTMG